MRVGHVMFAHLNLDRAPRTYWSHEYDPAEGNYQPGGAIRTIHFAEGRLQIDDLPILAPRITHHQVTWLQQTGGHFSSGHLYLDHDGTVLRGVVARGTTVVDAVSHDIAATSAPPAWYHTKITRRRYPDGTKPDSIPDSEWTDGLILKLHFSGPQQGLEVELANGDEWSTDVTNDRHAKIVNGHLVVTIIMTNPDVDCLVGDVYLNATATFDDTKAVPMFSGTVSSTCSDQTGTGSYLWKGTEARAALRANAVPAALPIHHDALLAGGGLGVGELYGLIPDASVMPVANDLLVKGMKWAMGNSDEERGWLQQFFGDIQPQLSDQEKKVVQLSEKWYQDSFAKAYLGWAIANYDGENAPSVRLRSDQMTKLSWYLQTGLAKAPDYITQQNGVYLNAYIQTKPRLGDYITDGGERWAQALFDDIIKSPGRLNNMLAGVWLQDNTEINNNCTLLSALQPSGELASKLYRRIVTTTIARTTSQTIFGDKETAMQWLPAFLDTFLTTVANTQNVPDEGKIAVQQLKDYINVTAGGATAVAEEIFDMIANARGSTFLGQAYGAQSAWADAHPTFAKAGKTFVIAGWSIGFFYVVGAFKNWKDLTAKMRTDIVVATVDMAAQGLLVMREMWSSAKDALKKVFDKMQAWCASDEGYQAIDDIMEADEVDAFGEVDNMRPLFNVEARAVQVEGTAWSKIFPVTSKVVGIIGAACAGYFAARSTENFIKDLKSGQGITRTALDGVIMAANLGAAVCLTLELFVTSTILSVAGAVLAIVGIVVAFVEMFVVKPDNPLNGFMSNVVIPFVDGLPAQTKPPDGTPVKTNVAPAF